MAFGKTQELTKRIQSYIRTNMPVRAGGKILDITDLSVKEPDALNNIEKQIEMKYKSSGDLKGWVRGKLVITDEKSKKVISQSGLMNIIPVYYITERGTYIVGGKEKNIFTQARRKPGVYTFFKSGSVNTEFYIDSAGGTYFPAISMNYDPKTMKFTLTVKSGGKSTNFDAINFLRELGVSDASIKSAMGNNSVSDMIFKQGHNKKTIYDIHKALLGKNSNDNEAITRLSVIEFLKNNGKFGSGTTVVKNTIGSTESSLGTATLLKSVKKMFSVLRNEESEDDISDVRFNEFLTDNDLIMEQIDRDFRKFKAGAAKLLESENKPSYVGLKSSFTDLGKSLDKFMKEGDLVQYVDQLNPLAVKGASTQITMVGGIGGLSSAGLDNVLKQRDVKGMSANRIDPIDTPESGRTGLNEHMAEGAIFKNKTAYIPVIKVVGGVATDNKRNAKELSPDDEYKRKVAFHDLRYVTRSGDKIVLKGQNGKVPGRYMGKIMDIPVREIEYIDKTPHGVWDTATNLIPFATQDDGNRLAFGTKMQRQAMVLKHRELPLVSAVDSNGVSFEQKMGQSLGKPVYSNVNGVVSSIDKNSISVKDANGKVHKHTYYNYYPVNQGYINNEVKVKVGDKVKVGSMLAEGWQTKDGQLALGVNARTAFMPYKGFNYEDGIVISESFAKKMTAEEVHEETCAIKENAIGGRGSGVREKLKEFTVDPEVFTKLDKDGIIKEGERVKAGSIVVASVVPRKDSENVRSSILTGNSIKYAAAYTRIDKNSYIDGIVKRVVTVGASEPGCKQKVIISIVQEKPLGLGDKLSGKHGNKGTITEIVADKEMPVGADGKPIEVIYSTAAVPSRKNIGQLFETSAGLIAEKTGKRVFVNNFDPKDRNKVVSGLKAIGSPEGKQTVFLKEKDSSGKLISIPTENPVTVGSMYMMRLNHQVDHKIQGRSNIEGYLSQKTKAPQKEIGGKPGEMHNPMRIGNMEMNALTAHKAVWNVLESSTFKSDGGGDAAQRMALFDAISTGKMDALNYSVAPQTLTVLKDTLTAAGLDVKPVNSATGKRSTFDSIYDSITLTPMKPNEMIKTIGKKNVVNKPFMWTSKDRVKKETDEPVKQGLIDPEIFGELNSEDGRNKWGYIQLATPIPNPILSGTKYNAYQALTGMKSADFSKLVNGQYVMVIDPDNYNGTAFQGMGVSEKKRKIAEIKNSMSRAGLKEGDLISPNKLEAIIAEFGEILWKAGGEGLLHKLDSINISKELKATKKALNSAKGKDIDMLYKKYRTLNMLKENKMEASDLMMRYVPVTPTYLRNPIVKGNTIINNDLNKLYSQLINANVPIAENTENGTDMYSSMNPVDAARATANLYKKTSGLTGVITAQDFKTGKDLKGLTDTLSGKDGLVKGQMLGKRVDFSGRSVIGVDPALGINETALPYDLARDMYRPFAIKQLLKTGRARNQEEAMKKLDNRDNDAVRALQEVADDRPVILHRAPALHKYSMQAYHPKIRTGTKNIQVNPLTVTGFNADFDGDTNQVFVPVSDNAKEEAKRLMMPSENLMNPANGKMIIEIRHEMALGLYYLTMGFDKPVGKTKSYPSISALYTDYKDGKINSKQRVAVTGVGRDITAGQALFNGMLPAQYRNFKKAWSSKDINNTMTQMYKDCEQSNGKTVSKNTIVSTYEKLKDLGFLASTRSGVSLGIQDFQEGVAVMGKIQSTLDKASKDKNKIIGWSAIENTVETKLKKGELLKPTNPVQILLNSGARGNASQFRRIMGSVGVGKRITGDAVDPIKHSHFEGLGPQEYIMHGSDSRKGMYDRSVSTAAPGAVTKDVVAAMQDVVIKENDCKTTDGIDINKNSPDILGRYAAQVIKSKDGKILCRRNEVISYSIRDAIYKDNSILSIKVRSPLRCKTINGVCQKCYGTAPGTMQLNHLGTPVGMIAAQAISEPVTQMTMNTFHTGGTAASSVAGLPKIKQLLGMRGDANNAAVLAKVSGKVVKIEKGRPGTFDKVLINNTPHIIPHLLGGGSHEIRVSVGDEVTKGDFLTVGNTIDIRNNKAGLSSANPKDLIELKTDAVGNIKALNETRDYLSASLTNAFNQAVGEGKISDRHLETIVSKLTSKAVVTDSGSANTVKGAVINTDSAQKWNAQNATPLSARRIPLSKAQELIGMVSNQVYKDRAGQIILKDKEQITMAHISRLLAAGYKTIQAYKSPIEIAPKLISYQEAGAYGSENWLSNLGTSHLKDQLGRGAMYGQTDTLSDSRARIMTGKMLPVGEGFSTPKTVINNIGTNIRNFFLKRKK